MNPEVCPHCGEEVPPGATFCPGCGSDEKTGWSEEAISDPLGLSEEKFNYDEFVKEEFGEEKKSPVPRGLHWFWWVVAIALLVGFLIFFFRR